MYAFCYNEKCFTVKAMKMEHVYYRLDKLHFIAGWKDCDTNLHAKMETCLK